MIRLSCPHTTVIMYCPISSPWQPTSCYRSNFSNYLLQVLFFKQRSDQSYVLCATGLSSQLRPGFRSQIKGCTPKMPYPINNIQLLTQIIIRQPENKAQGSNINAQGPIFNAQGSKLNIKAQSSIFNVRGLNANS